MNNFELLASTGDKNIDRIIRGVIGIFETIFPDRIRSYYLDGSYTDGTAIPHVSDIDGYIIFKQDFLNATEREYAWHLVNQCSHLTQPEFDIIPTTEGGLTYVDNVTLHFNSILMYGEDIRGQVPLPDIVLYSQILLYLIYRFFARVRGNPSFLTYPLEYPDPHAPFYGYDCRAIRTPDGNEQPSTKELINCVGKPALAMVTAETHMYVKNKTDCLMQYEQHIHDEWVDLLKEVYTNCRERWYYQIPQDADEQNLLRRLCQKTLAFENHFLRYYRQFFLNILLSSEQEQGFWINPGIANYFFDGAPSENIPAYHLQTRKKQGTIGIFIAEPFKTLAARALGQFVYPDDDMLISTLQTMATSQNCHLRAIAEQSLQRYQ